MVVILQLIFDAILRIPQLTDPDLPEPDRNQAIIALVGLIAVASFISYLIVTS